MEGRLDGLRELRKQSQWLNKMKQWALNLDVLMEYMGCPREILWDGLAGWDDLVWDGVPMSQ